MQNRFDTSEIGEDDSQIHASASSQEGSVSDKVSVLISFACASAHRAI